MDLTKFLGQDSQEQSAQRLSKEKAGEGRNLGYDRWKGTGGLPEWELLKRIP